MDDKMNIIDDLVQRLKQLCPFAAEKLCLYADEEHMECLKGYKLALECPFLPIDLSDCIDWEDDDDEEDD